MAIKTIDPSTISTPELHGILLSSVAPRPIAFASTINEKGEVNLSPFSFFNVFSANPPILIFSPARRGRDNTTKHTYENVKKIKEVVINIVNYPIVEQMSLSSTEYGEGVNEFTKSGLTEVASLKVTPPRVAESPVSFECTVEKIIELGNQGGAGNLVIAKVEMIHINDIYLDASERLDTEKLDLVARMGENWYCRSSGDALFEIPKPIFTKGIGVDSLPKHTRQSNILTGNDLGRLGNVEAIPSIEELNACKKTTELQKIIKSRQDRPTQIEMLHDLVKTHLKVGDLDLAIKTLFSLEETENEK